MDPGENPFSGSAAGDFYVTESRPSPGQTEVPTDVVLDVGFNRPVLPDAIGGGWQLRTGATFVTGSATVDLVDRRLRIRPARGLGKRLEYTLELSPMLRSFGEIPLRETQLTFRTGEGPDPNVVMAPRRTLQEDVLPALARGGCTVARCHAGREAARGLDLATPEGILGTIGRRSGEDPSRILLTRGAHATSYLLWKALGLGNPLGHDRPVLERDLARAVADWIDQGAP